MKSVTSTESHETNFDKHNTNNSKWNSRLHSWFRGPEGKGCHASSGSRTSVNEIIAYLNNKWRTVNKFYVTKPDWKYPITNLYDLILWRTGR